jgi:hypothetical protein
LHSELENVDWIPCWSISTTVTGNIPKLIGRVGAKISYVPETEMKDERGAG